MLHKKAFSLIELLVSLVIISLVVAAFAPIVTKKIKNQKTALNQKSTVTKNCAAHGLPDECKLCYKITELNESGEEQEKYKCLTCDIECGIDKYKNVEVAHVTPALMVANIVQVMENA